MPQEKKLLTPPLSVSILRTHMAENFQKLSILIPVFNEVQTVEQIIGRVRAADSRGLDKEIIVVDDASTDGTGDVLKKLQQNTDLKVFAHPYNRGKGAALRKALEHATGDIVLIQDADLEYDPSDYPKLLQPILDGRADVVYGSRFLGRHASRAAVLALCRQQVSHVPLQHVLQPESHRHGDGLQGLQTQVR